MPVATFSLWRTVAGAAALVRGRVARLMVPPHVADVRVEAALHGPPAGAAPLAPGSDLRVACPEPSYPHVPAPR